jgi:hypothetical protein
MITSPDRPRLASVSPLPLPRIRRTALPETSRDERDYAALLAAKSAAFKLALDDGARTVMRPAYPGAETKKVDVEPVAGLRAARDLELAARRHVLQYIRQAREAGRSWHDIGTNLRFSHGRDQAGPATAQAAFAYATDPDSHFTRTYGPSVAWTCSTCTNTVTEVGLDNHPADNERGHNPGCPRLQATIDDWEAEWDVPDAEREAEWDLPEAGQ